MNYGLTSQKQIEETILAVVGQLGPGPNAVKLLLGTCAAETNFGKAPDYHSLSGFGLFQLDKIAIDDIKARTRPHLRERIAEVWDVDLDAVEPAHLDKSPLLSAIFCRLHYLLVPEPIPGTPEGRAEYWKKHYNKNGKGTPEHYISMSEQLFKSDLYNAIN